MVLLHTTFKCRYSAHDKFQTSQPMLNDVFEGHPRSSEMTTFDTMHMSAYWSSTAMTAISLSAPPAAEKAFWVHFEPKNRVW